MVAGQFWATGHRLATTDVECRQKMMAVISLNKEFVKYSASRESEASRPYADHITHQVQLVYN